VKNQNRKMRLSCVLSLSGNHIDSFSMYVPSTGSSEVDSFIVLVLVVFVRKLMVHI